MEAAAEWKEKDIKDCPLGDDDDQVDAEENSLDDSQPWLRSFWCVRVGCVLSCIFFFLSQKLRF
jgi:hypothetical protein